MKRKEVSALYKGRIEELHQRVTHLERQRESFVNEVYRIRTHPKLSDTKRGLELHKYMKGNSYEDWVNYYNDHVDSLKSELLEHERTFHEYSKPEMNLWVAPIAIFFVLGVIAINVMLAPEVTTFATLEPKVPVVEKAVPIVKNGTVSANPDYTGEKRGP